MPTIDLTVERARHVYGAVRSITGKYTGPLAYVTGGDPLAAKDIALGDIEWITFDPPMNTDPACRLVAFDHATNKVVWFDLAGAEIANGVNLSGWTTRFLAHGK